MKKLMAMISFIMAFVSASALSSDADTEPSLWPACAPETGLWGYINCSGEILFQRMDDDGYPIDQCCKKRYN